jgi:hypothetical protein
VGLESEVRPRQDDGRHDRDLEEEAAVIKQFFDDLRIAGVKISAIRFLLVVFAKSILVPIL